MDEFYCIFVFHGSKNIESDNTIKAFSRNLKDKLDSSFSICFLKEKSPTLQEALEQAFIKGFNRIKCFPLFVLPGSHVNKDIPAIIQEFKTRHRDCSVEQMPCLTENKSFVNFVTEAIGESHG